MHDTTPALSADARNALRSAIVTHTDWCIYRRANGLSLASMTRAEYIATARALNIDVDGIAAVHGTGRQPQHRATPLKEHAMSAHSDHVSRFFDDLRDVANRLSERNEHAVGSHIYDTVNKIQSALNTPADSPSVHTARANANFPTSELTLGTRKVAAAVALLRRLGYDWCNRADAWTKIEW